MALIRAGTPTKVTFGLARSTESRRATVYEGRAYPYALTAGLTDHTIYLSRMPQAIIVDKVDLSDIVTSSSGIYIQDVSFDEVTGHAYVMFYTGDSTQLKVFQIPDLRTANSLASVKSPPRVFTLLGANFESNCLAVHDNVMHVLDGAIARNYSNTSTKTYRTIPYDIRTSSIVPASSSKVININPVVRNQAIGMFELTYGDTIVWIEGEGVPDVLEQTEEQQDEVFHPLRRVLYPTSLDFTNIYTQKVTYGTSGGRTGQLQTVTPTNPIFGRRNHGLASLPANIVPFVGIGIDASFTQDGLAPSNMVYCAMQSFEADANNVYQLGFHGIVTYNALIQMRNANALVSSAKWQSTNTRITYYPPLVADQNSALFDRCALVTAPTAAPADEDEGDNNPVVTVMRLALSIDGALDSFDKDGEVISAVPRRRTVQFVADRMPDFALTSSSDISFTHDGITYTLDDVKHEEFNEGLIYQFTCLYEPAVT